MQCTDESKLQKLVEQVLATHRGPAKRQPHEALGELQKYLFLVSLHEGEELSPGPVVDGLWHTLLLFPSLYADVCELLPGGELIDHDPTKERDEEGEKAAHYARTLELYEARWGPPSSKWWPQAETEGGSGGGGGGGCHAPTVDHDDQMELMQAIQAGGGSSFEIFVKTLTGKTFTLQVFRKYTAYMIKTMIQDKEGIPPDQQRLIHGGAQLGDEVPVFNYGVGSGSTIHLLLRLGGC